MFIMTDKKHKVGLLLQEYKNKISIMYCVQRDDKINPFWVYAQSQFKHKPSSKAMPHQINLGTPEQAKNILKVFLNEIDRIYYRNDGEPVNGVSITCSKSKNKDL